MKTFSQTPLKIALILVFVFLTLIILAIYSSASRGFIVPLIAITLVGQLLIIIYAFKALRLAVAQRGGHSSGRELELAREVAHTDIHTDRSGVRDPRANVIITDLVRQISDHVSRSCERYDLTLMEASSAFLLSQIDHALAAQSQVLSEGFITDLYQHLATTKHLLPRYNSYVQIQRKAYEVPSGWTSEWLSFIEESSSLAIRKQYIVLLEGNEIAAEYDKLRSMESFLSAHGFEFRICNVASVIEASGGRIMADGVIELFGDKVLKIGDLPEGNYEAGIDLKMTLMSGSLRPDLINMVHLIVKLSQKYKN